ncbi:hypothetical protein JCM19037_2092 [Geomicrobium sp. JCM 19037]|nr:PepSY domain-containing protein [Geomicrobium sp. JCM 19037]GAK03748.1 hypothetical protein JCM19037_2092 [Geomicrobium sp. JCM 19037]
MKKLLIATSCVGALTISAVGMSLYSANADTPTSTTTTSEPTNVEVEEQPQNSLSDDLFLHSDYIEVREAIDIAMNEVDGVVEEVTLERDRGGLEYEIELSHDTDVTINAQTGEIIDIEYD